MRKFGRLNGSLLAVPSFDKYPVSLEVDNNSVFRLSFFDEFKMSTSGKETLSLETFPEEISANATEDDDFIFASQILQAHGDEKIKFLKKSKLIRENKDLSSFDLLLPEVNCDSVKNDKNEVKKAQEKTSFRAARESIDDDFIKDTQEDIFISSFSSGEDQKVPKAGHTYPTGKFPITETQDFQLDFKVKKNADSVFNCGAELLMRSETKNIFDPSFSASPIDQTLHFDMKREKNLVQNNASPMLFTDDCTNLKEIQTSGFIENLTSGIILPTQPIQSKYNGHKDKDSNSNCNLLLRFQENPESFVMRHEESQMNVQESHWGGDETSFNCELKKMSFKLLVSCLVKKNKVTNKITEKLVLSVKELPRCTQHEKSKLDKFKKYSGEIRTINGEKDNTQGSEESTINLRSPNIFDCNLASELINEKFLHVEKEEGEKPIDGIRWTNEKLLILKLDDLIKHSLEKSIDITKHPTIEQTLELNSVQSIDDKKICDQDAIQFEEDAELFSSAGALEVRTKTEENTEELFGSEIYEFPQKVRRSKAMKLLNFDHSRYSQKLDIGEGSEKKNSERCYIRKRELSKRVEKTRINKPKVRLAQGESVLARYTVKQYYPGHLVANLNGGWRIKFSGGKVKTVSEEQIIPLKWLHPGDLVLALSNNNYTPGKIMAINFGNEITYNVELDEGGISLTVKGLNLSLTEAMAEILKERFTLLRPRISSEISASENLSDLDGVATEKVNQELNTSAVGLRMTENIQAQKGNLKRAKKRSYLKISSRKDEFAEPAKYYQPIQNEKKNSRNHPKKTIYQNLRSQRQMMNSFSHQESLEDMQIRESDSEEEKGFLDNSHHQNLNSQTPLIRKSRCKNKKIDLSPNSGRRRRKRKRKEIHRGKII